MFYTQFFWTILSVYIQHSAFTPQCESTLHTCTLKIICLVQQYAFLDAAIVQFGEFCLNFLDKLEQMNSKIGKPIQNFSFIIHFMLNQY